MEFRFNLNELFKQPIVEVGNSLIPPGFSGDKRALWDTQSKVTQIVNAMGEASARAQGLSKPITTTDRLRNSEHRLYLLIDQAENGGKGAVTGMLKTGEKGLYVFDREGQHFQVAPPCVLDFYVHESRQRSGLGKRLFEHMLQKEKIEPVKMAIDRPSEKFLGFLNKHYGLNSPVKQMNNYVVFDGFFPRCAENARTAESSPSSINKKQSANGLQQHFSQSPYGRYGAPRPPCSMGQIIHNDSPVIKRNQEPTGVCSEPITNIQGQNVINSNFAAWQTSQSLPNMAYQNQLPTPQIPIQANFNGNESDAQNVIQNQPCPSMNVENNDITHQHIMQQSAIPQQMYQQSQPQLYQQPSSNLYHRNNNGVWQLVSNYYYNPTSQQYEYVNHFPVASLSHPEVNKQSPEVPRDLLIAQTATDTQRIPPHVVQSTPAHPCHHLQNTVSAPVNYQRVASTPQTESTPIQYPMNQMPLHSTLSAPVNYQQQMIPNVMDSMHNHKIPTNERSMYTLPTLYNQHGQHIVEQNQLTGTGDAFTGQYNKEPDHQVSAPYNVTEENNATTQPNMEVPVSQAVPTVNAPIPAQSAHNIPASSDGQQMHNNLPRVVNEPNPMMFNQPYQSIPAHSAGQILSTQHPDAIPTQMQPRQSTLNIKERLNGTQGTTSAIPQYHGNTSTLNQSGEYQSDRNVDLSETCDMSKGYPPHNRQNEIVNPQTPIIMRN